MKSIADKVANLNDKLKKHGLELRGSTGSYDYQLYHGNKWLREVEQHVVVHTSQAALVKKWAALMQPVKMVDVRGTPIVVGAKAIVADEGNCLREATVTKITANKVWFGRGSRNPDQVCILEQPQ